jgi:PiT family inorganic phosphate transporter
MVGVYWGFRRFTPSQMDRHFRRYQLVSAALFSCAHGTNDAQKTMGIITAVLVAGGLQKDFHVPSWVIAASSGAIGLGTMSGGWRIVRTMGTRLTRLQPRSGFCAETGAAFSILIATWMGLPVSSTHAIAGAIAGVGSIQRTRAVRWHVAGGIVTAWVLTIPAAAAVSALVYCAVRVFVPGA